MKPISYFIDCPTIQEAMQVWGPQFQNLSAADRFKMIEVMARAACMYGVVEDTASPLDGAVWSFSQATTELTWDWNEVDSHFQAFWAGVDQDLTSPIEIACLIHAISQGLIPLSIMSTLRS